MRRTILALIVLLASPWLARTPPSSTSAGATVVPLSIHVPGPR